MNYIYDIILNFNEEIYDFYEWNKNDNFTHIRKIPVFKISSKDLKNIEDYHVTFETVFLEKIKNKTEIFAGRNIKILEYVCILSDGLNVLALKIKNNRIYYSKLIIEEETEVTEVLSRTKEVEIEYIIHDKKEQNIFKTRKEKEMENYVKKELKKLEMNHEEEKLKYLYFECYGKKDFNVKDLYKDLVLHQIYQILKLIQVNNV